MVNHLVTRCFDLNSDRAAARVLRAFIKNWSSSDIGLQQWDRFTTVLSPELVGSSKEDLA